MRKTMITMIMILSFLTIKAQNQNKPNSTERIQKISQELSVDKEKSTSLVKVLDEYQKSISQLMKNDKLEGKVKQEQLKALIQQQQQAIATLLSKEEQGKLKALMNSKYEGVRKAREVELKNKNKGITNQKKQ